MNPHLGRQVEVDDVVDGDVVEGEELEGGVRRISVCPEHHLGTRTGQQPAQAALIRAKL